jgi:hypothetical protein
VKFAQCRDCGDDIWWAETTEAKKMPINKWASTTGNVIPLDPEADTPLVIVLPKDRTKAMQVLLSLNVDPNARRYLSHFATCRIRHARSKR